MFCKVTQIIGSIFWEEKLKFNEIEKTAEHDN